MIKVANWAESLVPSAIQKSVSFSTRPEFTSFALGLPATELLPSSLLLQGIDDKLLDYFSLQYSPPIQPLKSHVVSLMEKRGIICDESQIFITTGAQQAMSLLTRLLINNNDTVALEELVYPGFLQAIQTLRPNILSIPTDYMAGIDLNALELALNQGERPSLIYIVADGHNPLGLSLSLEKRKKLVELAKSFKVPIIEDDPYGLLYYDQPLPTLKSLEPEWVMYIGSFSKLIAPSLRVGWIVAPEELMPKLSIIKEATDLNVSTLSQRIICSFLDKGYLEDHLSLLRSMYKKRRDVMLNSLDSFFAKKISYNIPTNGMFVWVELLQKINTYKLLDAAIEEKVTFIPGNSFAVSSKYTALNCMRLNFSYCNEDKIYHGIKSLSNALNKLV